MGDRRVDDRDALVLHDGAGAVREGVDDVGVGVVVVVVVECCAVVVDGVDEVVPEPDEVVDGDEVGDGDAVAVAVHVAVSVSVGVGVVVLLHDGWRVAMKRRSAVSSVAGLRTLTVSPT